MHAAQNLQRPDQVLQQRMQAIWGHIPTLSWADSLAPIQFSSASGCMCLSRWRSLLFTSYARWMDGWLAGWLEMWVRGGFWTHTNSTTSCDSLSLFGRVPLCKYSHQQQQQQQLVFIITSFHRSGCYSRIESQPASQSNKSSEPSGTEEQVKRARGRTTFTHSHMASH